MQGSEERKKATRQATRVFYPPPASGQPSISETPRPVTAPAPLSSKNPLTGASPTPPFYFHPRPTGQPTRLDTAPTSALPESLPERARNPDSWADQNGYRKEDVAGAGSKLARPAGPLPLRACGAGLRGHLAGDRGLEGWKWDVGVQRHLTQGSSQQKDGV